MEREKVVETADGPVTVTVRHPDGGGRCPVVIGFHDGPAPRENIHDVTRAL